MEISERWPNHADSATAGYFTIRVYDDAAILDTRPYDIYEPDGEQLVPASQLRDLAKLATWAADRLDARQ